MTQWKALHDADGDFAIYDQDGHLVAVTDKDTARDVSNAHLIAAAPELLQALELLLHNVIVWHPPDGILGCPSAKIAIAKAKGE